MKGLETDRSINEMLKLQGSFPFLWVRVIPTTWLSYEDKSEWNEFLSQKKKKVFN